MNNRAMKYSISVPLQVPYWVITNRNRKIFEENLSGNEKGNELFRPICRFPLYFLISPGCDSKWKYPRECSRGIFGDGKATLFLANIEVWHRAKFSIFITSKVISDFSFPICTFASSSSFTSPLVSSLSLFSVMVLTLGIFFFTYATSTAAAQKASTSVTPVTSPSYSFLAGGQCCDHDDEDNVRGEAFTLPLPRILFCSFLAFPLWCFNFFAIWFFFLTHFLSFCLLEIRSSMNFGVLILGIALFLNALMGPIQDDMYKVLSSPSPISQHFDFLSISLDLS